MHASLADYGRRRRRTARRRVLQVLLTVLLVGGTLGYAYRVGDSAGAARVAKLEAELERLEADNLELRDRLALSTQRTTDIERSLGVLQARLAREVAQGEAADLLGRIQRRLAAGIEATRLAFLIDAAGQAASCEGEPETKRFVVRTPVSQGPVSAVRFGARVVVTGTGEPARNQDGLAEAWFDPAAPLRFEFHTLDGAVASVSGVLPIHHSMLVDGREYRFGMVAGERGFVEVGAQICALPGTAPAFQAGAG